MHNLTINFNIHIIIPINKIPELIDSVEVYLSLKISTIIIIFDKFSYKDQILQCTIFLLILYVNYFHFSKELSIMDFRILIIRNILLFKP